MTPPVSQPLDTDFARHREAFVRSPFPAAGDRIDLLGRLEALVKENAGAWADAISRDFGNRSRHETQLLELFPSLEGIRHARRHLRRWMRPERRSTSLWFLPGSSRIVPQPLGVVGIVVPWNYPLYLAVGPLVAALAAGNRAMVKPSEFTPRVADCFATLFPRYFDNTEIAIVTGDAEVSAAFAGLPFDHLVFTGAGSIALSLIHISEPTRPY